MGDKAGNCKRCGALVSGQDYCDLCAGPVSQAYTCPECKEEFTEREPKNCIDHMSHEELREYAAAHRDENGCYRKTFIEMRKRLAEMNKVLNG